MNYSKIKEQAVLRIREFNRFYLPLLSLLGQSYLKSDYSMAEARVLYELYENKMCRAKDISTKLHIDKSYLSRMLKKFEHNGCLIKEVSKHDSRFNEIKLSDNGINITKQLIESSNNEIKDVLNDLSDEECAELISAINFVTRILSKKRVVNDGNN